MLKKLSPRTKVWYRIAQEIHLISSIFSPLHLLPFFPSNNNKIKVNYRQKSKGHIKNSIITMSAKPGGSSATPGPGQRLRYDCAVKGCRPSTFEVLSYHRIPSKDSKCRVDPRRPLWMEACHLMDAGLRDRRVICGMHFKASARQ